MIPNKTLQSIDRAIEAAQDTSFRLHLGASIIGRSCSRQLWYTFRWFKEERFPARVLRLFERGHDEEPRFEKLLRSIGVTLYTHDADGKQFRVTAVSGHFGGDSDGFGVGLLEIPKEPFVIEFKTHGYKSFRELKKKGVKKAKWEHYVQTQCYGYLKGVRVMLYCAVNKNDDDLHFELLRIKKEVAEKYITRAEYIIESEEAPPRIATTASWYECKMCLYKDICFGTEKPAVNCRTCKFSKPRRFKAHWSCHKTERLMAERKDFTACEKYKSL